MKLPISIIIPTYNRAELLPKILPTCLRQGCSEVIVVDDCSFPSVQSVMDRVAIPGASDCRLRVIRNHKRLQSPASRMVGVQASKEPFIFFGEDDVLLLPRHLEVLFKALQETRADGVASYCLRTTTWNPDPKAVTRLPLSSSVTDFVNVRDATIRTGHRISRHVMVPWLHAWALMPKELVLTHGFDSNYKGNAFREETDFFLQASHRGAKFFLVDAPPAFHYKGLQNMAGGQHGGKKFYTFVWYEYWVARNNYYFLRKNREALKSLGHKHGPALETVRYMLRRTLGYPGRFRFSIRQRYQAIVTESRRARGEGVPQDAWLD